MFTGGWVDEKNATFVIVKGNKKKALPTEVYIFMALY